MPVLVRHDEEGRHRPIGGPICVTPAGHDLEVHGVWRHLQPLDEVERAVIPPFGLLQKIEVCFDIRWPFPHDDLAVSSETEPRKVAYRGERLVILGIPGPKILLERHLCLGQLAGLADVPALIRDVDDRTALEIAIVENVQRADLTPLEEANGYELLIAEHGYTQNDLGDIIGKSRSHVANSLRLLKLPEGVQTMLAEGALSAGHARALSSTPDPASLARTIVERGLSVRDAEKLAQKAIEGGGQSNRAPRQKDADTLALEQTLSDRLGLSVVSDHKTNGGQIRISYKTLDQLDDLCRRLDRTPN